MSVLHIVTLVVSVSVQGVSGFLHPAFTVGFQTDQISVDWIRPVVFKHVFTNVGNMYNKDTGIAKIPFNGIYWITLNIAVMHSGVFQLVLKINGATTTLRARVEGTDYQSSRSACFKLQQGDNLGIFVQQRTLHTPFTYWSVVYIGSGPRAWIDPASQARVQHNPLPFSNVITSDKVGIWHDEFKWFTIQGESLYLVHLSAHGQRDLVLAVQVYVKNVGSWRDILVVGSVNNYTPSNGDAVFNFRKGTILRVMRKDSPGGVPTAYPGTMTLFSIVSIGSTAYGNRTAFTGETREDSLFDFLYNDWLNQPVRFDKVYINTNNNYNPATNIYTVPYDSVYIVSLRPYTRPVTLENNGSRYEWKCCLLLTIDLLSSSSQQLLSAQTKPWTPAGISVALYFRAGETLRVGARTDKDLTQANVWYGTIFSIANLPS